MNQIVSLSNINVGEHARIERLAATGAMRRRFLDIGLVADTEVTCIGRSPFGDPSAYLIRGAVIAIRKEDGDGILVRK